MRKIELIYVEVMNETEHIFIFATTFNGQQYAQMLILNIALPVVMQDEKLNKAIVTLTDINRETAKTAMDSRVI